MSSRSRIWTVLERYYDLRQNAPVSSPLGKLGTGGCDQVQGGVDGRTAWLCDVGTALAGLTDAEREQVELYYHEHRAWEDADARRRNATNEIYRSHDGVEQLLAQRSKREWRRIADRHARNLHNIRRRKIYRHAMDRLDVSLSIVMLMGGWWSVCQGVDNSLSNT